MPVKYKDYYATLGVGKGASQDEIRKAFRGLARIHHPDVAKDKKGAEAKFKEINEAYEVLSDPEKRQKYDTLGADWENGGFPPPPPGSRGRPAGGDPFGGGMSFGGTGFSDFFEQFFGSGGRGAVRGGGGFSGFPQDQRGGDIEADLLVSIEEALHGAKKKISFRRDGSSKVETYEVRIPNGVREGQRIRLAGQGESVGEPGSAGDLYLRVRFERHPHWRVDGSDLIYEVEITVPRVVLGTGVEVPTPNGSVRLKIPAGSQPGRKFRLKGRGLPTAGETRGDFFVQLTVVLPDKLTDSERGIWEQLARLEA